MSGQIIFYANNICIFELVRPYIKGADYNMALCRNNSKIRGSSFGINAISFQKFQAFLNLLLGILLQ